MKPAKQMTRNYNSQNKKKKEKGNSQLDFVRAVI